MYQRTRAWRVIISSSSLITVSEGRAGIQDSAQSVYSITYHHQHRKPAYAFLASPFNIIFLKAGRMILNRAS